MVEKNSAFSNSGSCPSAQGLYDPAHEHDACGVGFIANIKGVASHSIIDSAVSGLKNLAHRGAIDADAVTGDGAGIMTQLPYELMEAFLGENGLEYSGKRSRLALAMVFLPRIDETAFSGAQSVVETAIQGEGLRFIAWREVPIDNSSLGRKAENTRPNIYQALIESPEGMDENDFERHLLLCQKSIARESLAQNFEELYVVSMSHKTVTYKGLLNAPQVRSFFTDLKNPEFKSAFAVFHQRFATNTFPDWKKAQPFRMLAHNGEINTIRGNRNNMKAREYSEAHGVWGDRYKDLIPIVQESMSDSASFDNSLQVMTVAGRDVRTGVSIMMPMAWEENREISTELRDFYKHHAVMMEPWDGPAAIVFSDGRYVGACLDRNGLRPARYKLYKDGVIILASEAGLIPYDGEVVRAGRLGPGKIIAVDLENQCLQEDDQIKTFLANGDNYTEWCDDAVEDLSDLVTDAPVRSEFVVPEEEITSLRVAFGYDLDEEHLVLKPMLEKGKEPIASMGDDTPLAVMSRRPRLLYTYFKQLFAQVTNPAIDSLRERSVMSTKMHLGGRLGLFDDMVQPHHFVALESPILLDHELAALFESESIGKHILRIDTTFPAESGPDGLEASVLAIRMEARKALESSDIRVLILSDKGVCKDRVAVPMLLATGAIHSELVEMGKRLQCDIIAESGEVRDVHQTACLLGFGANAVYPYLSLDIIRKIVQGKELGSEDETVEISLDVAFENYRNALNGGLLKVMSKMGISTLFSYQGAKIFEAVGVSQEVVDDCFSGAACPIGGIGYEEIAAESLYRHLEAYPEEGEAALWNEGYLGVNKKGGEFHAWNSKVVSGMNTFLRKGGDLSFFKSFREASDSHAPVTIKDLLRLKISKKGQIPLEEVESVEEIRRRFTTAGMSLGALSPEMHETLAIAMNRIGGKSNSGEGGEDAKRYKPYENGDNANSAIKQVASGRFGVTAEYLANAKEIEIKVAQGAKPGEGGQLMGWKVSPLIARLRFSVPGVTLISPPPHHDIYSIEDLAQLIFDLKEVNPRAKVCVKLVSSSGVGTIAAGVAKAYADVILVSGHDGGTGASPISSIKHAGSAWEIGLSEAHQVLMLNDLRSRVTLRTDGGMKTGRDIVIAALLGAEEFNFGTSALIAGGCAMFRVCHLNTCPVGVATQREDLRAKFRGKPEYVINYFNAVAEDVRILMSKLGIRTMDELIGRTDKLEALSDPRNPKTETVDLSRLLYTVDKTWESPRIHTRARNDRFGNEGSLDDTVLQEAKETITHMEPPFKASYRVRNTDRNLGTHISGEIAYLHGNKGLKPGTIEIAYKGSAGQGLGTFLVNGLRLRLTGDSNDYVGKGMNGGEIIISPSVQETFTWQDNTIIGNTCLYGATGGYLFAAGQAGERFAVRNSGATAVVEGVGEHACEYMTGGTIVCLGETGRNFGAGMSGGIAFVYDPEQTFNSHLNTEMVKSDAELSIDECYGLKRLIQLHLKATGSPLAKKMLSDWESVSNDFLKVIPSSEGVSEQSSLDLDEKLQLLSF